MRWTLGIFGALQAAGLTMILRGGAGFEEVLPRPLHSMILAWHVVILLPWLAWRIVRAIITTVGKIACLVRRVRVVRAEQHVAPVVMNSGPAVTRREFLGAAAALTPPMLTLAAAGIGEAQLDGFRIRRIEVPVPDLPPALEGMSIAHISDFHVGRFTRGRVLERIVEETNRLGADVVALTGDFINHSLRDLPAALDIVRRCARGTSSGRARAITTSSRTRAFFAARRSAADAAAARRERDGGHPRPARAAPRTPVEPQRRRDARQRGGTARAARSRSVAAAARAPSARVGFCGGHPAHALRPHARRAAHAHGPPRGGIDFVRYWSGLYSRRSGALVVSNGVGNWFPVRIQAPAEILHLTLRRTVIQDGPKIIAGL